MKYTSLSLALMLVQTWTSSASAQYVRSGGLRNERGDTLMDDIHLAVDGGSDLVDVPEFDISHSRNLGEDMDVEDADDETEDDTGDRELRVTSKQRNLDEDMDVGDADEHTEDDAEERELLRVTSKSRNLGGCCRAFTKKCNCCVKCGGRKFCINRCMGNSKNVPEVPSNNENKNNNDTTGGSSNIENKKKKKKKL